MWKTGSGFDPSHNGQGRGVLLSAEKFGHDPRIRRGAARIITQGTQPFHMLGLVGKVLVGKLLGGDRLLQALGEVRQCQQAVLEQVTQDLIRARDRLIVEASNHHLEEVPSAFLVRGPTRRSHGLQLLG